MISHRHLHPVTAKELITKFWSIGVHILYGNLRNWLRHVQITSREIEYGSLSCPGFCYSVYHLTVCSRSCTPNNVLPISYKRRNRIEMVILLLSCRLFNCGVTFLFIYNFCFHRCPDESLFIRGSANLCRTVSWHLFTVQVVSSNIYWLLQRKTNFIWEEIKNFNQNKHLRVNQSLLQTVWFLEKTHPSSKVDLEDAQIGKFVCDFNVLPTKISLLSFNLF